MDLLAVAIEHTDDEIAYRGYGEAGLQRGPDDVKVVVEIAA